MNRSAFFERIKNLLLFPTYEWKVISLEKRSFRDVFSSYVWRLIFAGALAQFAGSFFFVRNVLDIDAYRFSFPLAQAIIYILIQVLIIFTGSFFINGVASRFQSEKDAVKAAKLFAFSYTPVLLAFVIANLHEVLFVALIFGFYAVYLFWTGCHLMIQTPGVRRPAFTFLYIILILGLFFVFTRLFGYLSALLFPGIGVV